MKATPDDKKLMKKCVVTISSTSEIYSDNYATSDCDLLNTIDNTTVTFHTTESNLQESLMEFLKRYIEKSLYEPYRSKVLKESLENEPDEYRFWMCNQKNEEHEEPTKEQLLMWEEGEEKLYIQNTCVMMEVNDLVITNDTLYRILFS